MTLTARLTLLLGLLWTVLLLLSVFTVYWVLNSSLESRVADTLSSDATRLAALYASGDTGSVPPGSGGVSIALYDFSGLPVLLPSKKMLLPRAVVAAAGKKSRIYHGTDFLAAYIESPLGVLVFAESIGFIGALVTSVAKTLGLFFVLALLAGLLFVRVVSVWAAKPLLEASRTIAQRGPEDLSPVPYRGPTDELGLIVTRLNSLLGALENARKRERTFLAEVSHELRSPLTTLTGYLERLAKNPHEAQAIEGARRTVKHLSRLVGDLLQLAHGEAQRDVNPFIVDLREILTPLAKEFPGVRLSLPAASLEVLGDPDRLAQLARNLVANGIRAAGGASGVGISARSSQDQGYVLFQVRDTGMGIASEILPHLFERFSRGPEGGTGLGLAIAQQIAKAHQGRIEVDSEPGHTVFTVWLPALREDGDSD